MIGKTLGRYEITGLLGKGGMGEVYRTLDTSLNREVALKVLPPGFSHDLERVARFEREATTLAKLQHTNIATIYGFEQDQDQRFLANRANPEIRKHYGIRVVFDWGDKLKDVRQ